MLLLLILFLSPSFLLSDYTISNINRFTNSITAILKYNNNHHNNNNHNNNNINTLRLVITYETESRLRIHIAPSIKENDEYFYELPNSYLNDHVGNNNEPHYKVIMEEGIFTINVYQNINNQQINIARYINLTVAHQYLEITNVIPKESIVYGFGERDFNLNMKMNVPYTIFSTDNSDTNSTNYQYGAHPFYIRPDINTGSASGSLLWNPHSMDITLYPNGYLNYKVVGGVFDFFVFAANSPAELLKEYFKLIGFPFIPPLWSLGYQQSRFGYETLNKTREVVETFMKLKIPLDGIWSDQDYTNYYSPFTIDPVRFNGINEFGLYLDKVGKHHVFVINPSIPLRNSTNILNNGLNNNVFITRWNQSSPQLGKGWASQPALYPDFTNDATLDWWIDSFNYMAAQGAYFDDMNEPSSFVNGNYPNGLRSHSGPPWLENPANSEDFAMFEMWDVYAAEQTSLYDSSPESYDSLFIHDPPYIPGYGILSDVNGPMENLDYHTLSMSSNQKLAKHYSLHNLYGYHQSITTQSALQSMHNKRAFVISRSTFVGSGKFSSHWTGDNFSTWESMALSIPHILSFGFFGIPHAGANICGFHGNVTEELCTRWMQLGAFYPLARNHNNWDTVSQEPYSFGTINSTLFSASMASIKLRYTLMPYIYNLFYCAALTGSLVAKPVFMDFPTDPLSYGLETSTGQFMLGSSFMICPVLTPGVEDVNIYLPNQDWYIFPQGFHLSTYKSEATSGIKTVLPAPLDGVLPVLMQGGQIAITASTNSVKLNAPDTLLNSKFVIYIALSTQVSYNAEINYFYMDSGVSVSPLDIMNPEYLKWSIAYFYDVVSSDFHIRIAFIQNATSFRIPSEVAIDSFVIFGLSNNYYSAIMKSQLGIDLTTSYDDFNTAYTISGCSKINLYDSIEIVLTFSNGGNIPSNNDNDPSIFNWIYIISGFTVGILCCGAFFYWKLPSEEATKKRRLIDSENQVQYRRF